MATKQHKLQQLRFAVAFHNHQTNEHFINTNNVTGHHRGLKCKRMFVCRYVVPAPGKCYHTTLLHCH